MESPFFRTYNNGARPRYSTNSRSVPVNQPTRPSPPKVVSIPVHFVGSAKTRSAAAVKIQKVFRGFVVRKNVKAILRVKTEVDEIERRVSQREMADLIRRDAKERLKFNEMLMALLFRLDSVRGVDSGVRVCRKAVTKKVISMQDKVDAIVAGEVADQERASTDQIVESEDPVDPSGNCETDNDALDQTLEMKDLVESSCNCDGETQKNVDETVETKDPDESACDCETLIDVRDQAPETEGIVDSLGNSQIVVDAVDQTVQKDDPVESACNCEAELDAVDQTPETTSSGDCKSVAESKVETIEMQNGDESLNNYESDLVDSVIDCKCTEGDEATETKCEEALESFESHQSSVEEEGTVEKQEDLIDISEIRENAVDGGDKRCDETREMMQRILEENDTLKGLVTELCANTVSQNRLISALSQRVEQLERVVTRCEMRRKKKRQPATLDKSEAAIGGNKCGRKS